MMQEQLSGDVKTKKAKHNKVVCAICKNTFRNGTYSIDRLTVANVLIGAWGNYFAELNKVLALISSSTSECNSLEAQP